jgi:hypothetical protein
MKTVILAALAVALLACAPAAQAELRVTGDARGLLVEADRATMEEVLAALRDKTGLDYRSAVRLDAPFTGRLTGSLDQIVEKLLAGDYSYVFRAAALRPRLEIVAAGSDTGQASASATAGGAATPFVLRRPAKRFDATQALLWDETLRYGDAVVTDAGVRVFEGNWICPHAIADFRTLAESSTLSNGRRLVLAEIDRALKMRDGARPIVASDPQSLTNHPHPSPLRE